MSFLGALNIRQSKHGLSGDQSKDLDRSEANSSGTPAFSTCPDEMVAMDELTSDTLRTKASPVHSYPSVTSPLYYIGCGRRAQDTKPTKVNRWLRLRNF